MAAAFRALRSGNGAERQRVFFCSLGVGTADEVVKRAVEVVGQL